MRAHDSGEAEQLSALIGTVYDAALDPARWIDAVEQACRFLNCGAGVLGAADSLRSDINLLIHWGYDPDYFQRYLDHYFHIDPLMQPAYRRRVGEVFTFSGYEGRADVLKSAYYKEWVEPQGWIDLMECALDRTASGIALLRCVRHKDVGYVTNAEIRRMKLIVPHFRRAVLIGKVIDHHKIRSAAFAETIDGLATAVFLVNAQGGLVHANHSAQAMLDTRDPFTAVRGVLTAFDQRTNRALGEAVVAARDGDAGIEASGIAIHLSGPGGDHFIAHVLPLTAGARRQAGTIHAAVAALFVRKAVIDLPAAIGAATQIYGLTPAEGRVLRAVIEVGGVEPVAAMLDASRSTIKTHLEHLFGKTGTRRQADLVKLVAGFESPARRRKQK